MRNLASLFVASGLLACSMSAIAADYNNPNAPDDSRRARVNSATNIAADSGRGADANAAIPGDLVRDGSAKAEYSNECAWGLANGQHVQTTCAINMTAGNGKTYCFSSDQAMAAFMKDPANNMSKADATYRRS